jgi:hypothetical protein
MAAPRMDFYRQQATNRGYTMPLSMETTPHANCLIIQKIAWNFIGLKAPYFFRELCTFTTGINIREELELSQLGFGRPKA